MNTIAHSLPHHVGSSPFGPGGSFADFELLSRLQAERHASAEITLETTEGDRVSLSATVGQRAAFERYDARGRLEGGEAHRQGQSRGFTFSDAFQIRVEGDLNEAELADIRRILGAQEELLSDFLKKGRIEDDFAEELELDTLGTIAGVDASFDVSQRIDATRHFSGAGHEDNEKKHDDDHHERHDGDHHDKKINRHGVNKLIGKLFHTLDEHSDNPAKIAKKLPKLIDKLFRKIGDEHGFGTPKQRLAEHITDRFLDVLDAFVANPGGGLPSDETPKGPNTGAPPLDAPTGTPDIPADPADPATRPAWDSGPTGFQSAGANETPSTSSNGRVTRADEQNPGHGTNSVTRLDVEQRFSGAFHAHLDFSYRRNPDSSGGDSPVDPAAHVPATPSEPKPAPQELPGVVLVNPVAGTTPVIPNIAAAPTPVIPTLGTIGDAVKPDPAPSLSTLLDRLQGPPSGLSAGDGGTAALPSVVFGAPRPGIPAIPNDPAPPSPGLPTGSIPDLLNRLQSPNSASGLSRPSVSFFA